MHVVEQHRHRASRGHTLEQPADRARYEMTLTRRRRRDAGDPRDRRQRHGQLRQQVFSEAGERLAPRSGDVVVQSLDPQREGNVALQLRCPSC